MEKSAVCRAATVDRHANRSTPASRDKTSNRCLTSSKVLLHRVSTCSRSRSERNSAPRVSHSEKRLAKMNPKLRYQTSKSKRPQNINELIARYNAQLHAIAENTSANTFNFMQNRANNPYASSSSNTGEVPIGKCCLLQIPP